MKLKIKDLNGHVVKEVALPAQFNETYRPDLIERAFLAIRSHNRQPFGANPNAGKGHVTKLSRRRRDYKGAYGRGISRVPRKTLLRRGTQFYWVAALAPGTVGGRRAHPPKVEKNWAEKINNKERRKAIRSAIASTLNVDLIKVRNHLFPTDFPFGVDDEIKNIAKTNKLLNVLKTLGFGNDLERARIKTIRAGKGKMRGRYYKTKKSLLIVVDDKSAVFKAAANIPGVDVVRVGQLNAELLSPGAHGIRLTIWTEGALNVLKDSNLFM